VESEEGPGTRAQGSELARPFGPGAVRGGAARRAYSLWTKINVNKRKSTCSFPNIREMMHFLPSLLWLVCLPQEAPLELVAITHVGLVDVAKGELQPDQTVLIRGDRIAWVGPASEASVPDGAVLVQGKGMFLIPGLWDMHVHLQWNWDAEVSLPLFLAYGVTGVRDMASDNRDPSADRPSLPGLRAWREQIERGELLGPRLLALSTWPVARDQDIGGDAGALVDSFVERGADFIKVMQGLSADAYFDLVFTAEEHGLPVTGHVPLSLGMIEASMAGQVSIEHARDFLFDGFPGSADWRSTTDTQNPPTAVLRRMVDEHDPELVRRVAEVMVENETRYVPTHITRRFDAMADDEAFRADPREVYIPALRWDGWGFDAENVVARDPSPAGREVLMEFYTRGLEATGTAMRAGVQILAGTDANDSYAFPGSGLHEELEELVKAGLTPAQALKAATLSGALFLEKTADFGSIAAGKKADLVLLRENPLVDVSNTQAIETVFFDGRAYVREDLDEMLERVAAFVAEMNPGIELPSESLDRYVGSYESPQGTLAVSKAGDTLYLRFPRRGGMRLRALSETEFVFLPRAASVTFDLSDEGEVLSLRFEQGGQGGTAKKVE
jgi:imidazolonepropionase-like amidohydrolase